ncbi:MAG: aminotransferase class V-fold PLP-dependent enzyme [Methanoregulaceae archaeon]|nr:aminotransferase class V-fold PLP-dependent enzyme [Methanoregulaceae archaeon]
MTEPLIYLNNAATTWPKPPEVLKAATDVFSSPFYEHGRTTVKDAPDYIGTARQTVADFFGVSRPEHIIFTSSATDSLNLLIHGFAKRYGKPFHAITTDLEHNSVLRPLRTLEREGKCSLSIIRTTGPHVRMEEIREIMTDDTALVVIGHGSNVLGSVQDIEAIGNQVRSSGAFFLVDGAQTAGQYPAEAGNLPVDAFVFTGHKSLFGLPGTGGFYIRSPEQVDPVRQGGTGVDSAGKYQPEELPLKFETGTPNYPGIAALDAGTVFVRRKGVDTILSESTRMTSYLVKTLGETEGVRLYNPSPDLPVITFSLENMESEDIGFILWKAYRVIVRTGLHCSPLIHERINTAGGVRISLSCMSTMEECERAVAAIEEIAKTMGGYWVK